MISMKNMTDNPNTYYYRHQASVVYRQPNGDDKAAAETLFWAAGCHQAEDAVKELERLRKENVELQKKQLNELTGDKHERSKAVQH